MAATRRLTELVRGAIPRLVLPEGPVTVGLSGGADSAALAHLVLQAGRETSSIHIDHGLTGSRSLARAARAIAAQLVIPLETVSVDVAPGPSPEERAREARYEVFDTVGRPLLTAHTRDDSAETILINLIRGTGTAGLTGIPFHRPPNIYRPMLDISRGETRELATLAGLPFVDDPMNDDLELTRNKIRRELLPKMREINPQVVEAVTRAGSSLASDSEFIAESVASIRVGRISAGLITTLPPALAARLIGRFLTQSGVGVTADRLGRVWSVARGDSDRQDLAEGRSVVRLGALLIIE